MNDRVPDTRLYRVGIALAILTALALRFIPALTVDFPLNDGGMFYKMTQEIRAKGYSLPEFSGYNLRSIPFAYPPLGFYIAALLHDVSSIELLTLFRLLPALYSTLTVLFVILLAQQMSSNRSWILAVSFCFAVMYINFIWPIMGGGITRSLGFMLAAAALYTFQRSLNERKFHLKLICALLTAACVCSHLGPAVFTYFSLLMLTLAFEDKFTIKIKSLITVVLISAFLSLPWILTVYTYHGLAPFQAAGQTVGSISSLGNDFFTVLGSMSSEWQRSYWQPFIPVFGFFTALGIVHLIRQKKMIYLFWWLLIPLIDRRQGFHCASIPLSMIVAYGLVYEFLPILRQRLDVSKLFQKPKMQNLAVYGILGVIFAYSCMSASVFGTSSRKAELASISKPELRAIEWLKQELPGKSNVLVIEKNSWWTARFSEWIPTLTSHHVPNTVQGTEWLSNSRYAILESYSLGLNKCLAEDLECLETWEDSAKLKYQYIFIPASSFTAAEPLINSLKKSAKYKNLFEIKDEGLVLEKLPSL